MGVIRQAARGILSGLLPRERFLVSGPGAERSVALTFDDGPHPEHTPRLLDRLAELDIRATFFVIGREAERHPDIVARAAHEGHAIGHHSWSHSEPALTSTRQLLDEVDRTVALLASITGRLSDRFRPPKGALTAGKLQSLLRAGQRIVLWSADPRDYLMNDGEELREWAAAHLAVPGEIVLLHDVHPHAACALDSFMTWRSQGVEFVTIDHWLPAAPETK